MKKTGTKWQRLQAPTREPRAKSSGQAKYAKS
jgi:hypothetical protein